MTRKPRARRISRRTQALIALVLAETALFAVLVPIHSTAYGTILPITMLLGAAMCAAPLVALSQPRIATALFCVAAFTLPLVVSPERDAVWPWPWSVPALLTFAVFVFVLTLLHGWRTGLVPLAIGMMGSLAAPLMLTRAAPLDAAGANLIVTASIASAAFLVAVLLAGRIRVGEELTKERELTALEQSRRILVEERTRIARELHDVVAHSMSLIQVQASTAKYRLPDLAPDAAAEFDDIAGVARGSLGEMRRILGVLRTEDHAAQLAPQQGIGDIPALVESIRKAGGIVDLSLAPAAHDAPPSVQITAFRIVQEALSNAVRHAPGSAITVSLDSGDDRVTVRVHNTGTDQPLPPAIAGGHGLLGMQERVTLLGGSLIVGPDPAGGWTVTAVLPYTVHRKEPS